MEKKLQLAKENTSLEVTFGTILYLWCGKSEEFLLADGGKNILQHIKE